MDEMRYCVLKGRRGGYGRTYKQEIDFMVEGNPGCLQFICELLKLPEGWEAFIVLKDLGLSGSRAYQYWNDCHHRDTEQAAELLMLYKAGKITQEEIIDHVDLPFGVGFNMAEIREREPRPTRMVKKIVVGHDPRYRGSRAGEEMEMRIAYRRLMDGMFTDTQDIGKTFKVEVEDVVDNGERCLVARKTEVRHG